MTAPAGAATSWRDALRCDPAAAWLAAATVLFHLLTARGYGIFRDELYYLACAEHLDWGYVDHPPLVAALVWILRHPLGTSLPALRLPLADLWPRLKHFDERRA